MEKLTESRDRFPAWTNHLELGAAIAYVISDDMAQPIFDETATYLTSGALHLPPLLGVVQVPELVSGAAWWSVHRHPLINEPRHGVVGEVVAFDENVLAGVPVDRFFRDRCKRCGGRCLSDADGVAFAWPGESEPFLIILNVLSQNRFEGFEVDLPIGYRFGEQFSGLRSRFGGEVWCGAGTWWVGSVIRCSIISRSGMWPNAQNILCGVKSNRSYRLSTSRDFFDSCERIRIQWEGTLC